MHKIQAELDQALAMKRELDALKAALAKKREAEMEIDELIGLQQELPA